MNSIVALVVVDEPNDQPGRSCHWCKAPSDKEDLRPYGPNGAWVCFPCGMSPAHKATTEAALHAALDAAGNQVLIGGGAGPRPLNGSVGQ